MGNNNFILELLLLIQRYFIITHNGHCNVMEIVKGNKTLKITTNELNNLINKYNKVVLDMGTGDGRFIYKQALNTPTTFFMGIDPSEKQLKVYSKEANKKKLENVLFVVGSIENLPEELNTVKFDELYINLPWGTLLENIVKPTEITLNKLFNLSKVSGKIYITFGYTPETEPSEVSRLKLPEIDENYLKNIVIKKFEEYFKLEKFEIIQKEQLKNLNTTWGNKLAFGSDRPIFMLTFIHEDKISALEGSS